jgi:hypothetical protein
MSFNTLIRNYIEEKPAAVKTVEEKVAQRSWFKKLFAPAALGLSLGFGMLQLAACGGTEPVGEEETLTGDEGKEDSLGKKKCTTHKQCGAGMFCKKASSPVITPKYGVQPPPYTPMYGVPSQPPTISPKYGVTPPTVKYGTCKPLAECNDNADCAEGQRCVGAEPAPKVGKCPEGAYCILPPPPQPGICMNECSSDKDCAKGETCQGESSGCPEGAYCILPPTPKKGVCEVKVYAILPPASK